MIRWPRQGQTVDVLIQGLREGCVTGFHDGLLRRQCFVHSEGAMVMGSMLDSGVRSY